MLKKRLALIALIAVFATGLAGCSGGGAKVNSVATTTTMGQELKDLDEAHQKGLLTDREYDKAKKTILNRYK